MVLTTLSQTFFIDANSFMVQYLVTIFNRIFDTCIYPEAWNNGVIVPILKKGDRINPRNYRGITLINSLAKLFSLCLRNRLNAWCEQEHIYTESQIGFRDKRSTVDCVYILHSLIQNIVSLNKKVFCAFIDYGV